jgi:hypothetical protein
MPESSTLRFQVLRYDDLEIILCGKVADIGGQASISARLGGVMKT